MEDISVSYLKKYIALLLMLGLTTGLIFAQFSGGTGTEEDPFLIANVNDLAGIDNYLGATGNGLFYKQTATINLNAAPYNEGEGWIPIGSSSTNSFRSNYDGNGFKITNLYMRSTENYIGLFGYIRGAHFKNIILEDVDIRGGRYLGALVGYSRYANASFENCAVTGTIVSFDGDVGGILGNSYSHTVVIRNSFVDMDIVAQSQYVGGIVGGAVGSSTSRPITNIYNCFSKGDIRRADLGHYVGGIIGRTYAGRVENSYSLMVINNGETLPTTYAGSMTSAGEGTFTGYYWDTEVSQQALPWRQGPTTNARNTQEMTFPFAANTYVGWDFNNIWSGVAHFNDGYPFLRWQLRASSIMIAGEEIIILGSEEPITVTYNVRAYNQLGDIVDDEEVAWVLEDILGNNVDLARTSLSNDGLLTINPEAEAGTIRLTAYSLKSPDISGVHDVELRESSIPFSIEIAGEENIYIQQNEGDQTILYTAIVFDQYATPLPDYTISWSVYDIEGDNVLNEFVTINSNGLLTIHHQTVPGSFGINGVMAENENISNQMTVNLFAPPVLASIVINGSTELVIPASGSLTYQYSYLSYNQYGGQIANQPVSWTLQDIEGTNSTNGFTTISNSGVLTVTNEAEEGRIKLSVVSLHNADVSADLTIDLNAVIPAVPNNLTAIQSGENIVLNWLPPIIDETSGDYNRIELTGYNIYRNNNQINLTLVSGNQYTDTNINYGIEYAYFVTAVYDIGESAPSNTVLITIFSAYPPPLNLEYEIIGFGIQLSWQNPEYSNQENDESRLVLQNYRIYKDGSFLINIQPSVNQYTDNYIFNDNHYSYFVTALYDQGESNPSNTVEVYFLNVNEGLIPPKTEVHGNYPNPFNPQTTISFSLSEEMPITITIFNIKGQFISTLMNKLLLPGKYDIVWNGIDDRGEELSSGIYLYRLNTRNETFINKMLLSK